SVDALADARSVVDISHGRNDCRQHGINRSRMGTDAADFSWNQPIDAKAESCLFLLVLADWHNSPWRILLLDVARPRLAFRSSHWAGHRHGNFCFRRPRHAAGSNRLAA